MGYITYKQADSRWGKKNYNGSSSMATAGCGPTSVAMLAYAVDGKTNPWDVAKYMQKHGYAIRNNGTAWAGIPAAMKAFGLQDVKEVVKMTDVWNYLSKGYCADFLFGSGSRGGITWTSSGHYVAVTDYKVKNGKHYLYTRDSGGRNHTGWYCYETQMRGLIPKVWVGLVPKGKTAPASTNTKPKTKYTGIIPKPTLKKGSKGDSTKNLQKFLNWYHPAWNLKVDGIFGSDTAYAVCGFQDMEGLKDDGIYGEKSYAKANAYKQNTTPPKKTTTVPVKTETSKGYSGSFPDLIVHSGQKIAYTAKALAYSKGTPKRTYTYGKGHATLAFQKAINAVYPKRSSWSKQCQAGASCDVGAGTVIRYSGIDPKIPRGLEEQIPHLANSNRFKKTNLTKTSDMKAGDVGVYTGKTKGAHIWIGLGNNLIAEANHTAKYFLHIDTDNYTSSGKKVWGIYRPCIASAIGAGDKGTEVTKLQKFLNWFGNYGLVVDGDCGIKTSTAIKDYQKKVGVTVDGYFGSASLVKAKAYKKKLNSPTSNTVSSSALPKKCIDVSYWQGKISKDNWLKIKKTCGYAICRATWTHEGSFKLDRDSTFDNNYKNAMAAGLKVGAYHYSQAITVAEAKAEAKYFCDVLDKYSKPTFWVACDFEFGGRLNRKIGTKASDVANAFCDVVKSRGYEVCIYANFDMLNGYLKNPKYPVWIAQYSSSCSYKKPKIMWQYTSQGRVDGISAKNTNNNSADVDLSYIYE